MKINVENQEKLQEALDAVQGRCTARTISAQDIARIIKNAEKKLNLPKKSLKGCKIDYTGGQKFPSAYKFTPESTHFVAEFNGKAWFVVFLDRQRCPSCEKNATIDLTEEAKKAIISSFESVLL